MLRPWQYAAVGSHTSHDKCTGKQARLARCVAIQAGAISVQLLT